ncbi:MAG: hypothetical protein H7333_01695 [Bdellovibrionales bacterium]|nr:hypothetical protein [Oligoflexia bacterium]
MVRLNVKEWLSAKIEDERIRYWLWFVVLASGLLLIYGHLFYLDPFLSYDDPRVISPMEPVHSWHDYWSRVKSAEIVDLQPVRDFVTWVDYLILSYFKLSTFHFTNVVLWFSCILCFRKLLLVILDRKSKWVELFTLYVAFNPLYVTSIAWLSSRKHLLAALFILMASIRLFEYTKQQRKGVFGLTLFYTLAVFSQPIVVGWPLWLGVVLYLNGKPKVRELVVFLPLFLIMLATVILNYKYYNGEQYLLISGGFTKYNDQINNFNVKLFMFGRYFLQVLIPYWVSFTVYSFASLQNVIGIFLLPVGIYLFWKCLGLRTTMIWFSFYMVILCPVILKMTQIPGHDTYLCAAGFGIFVLLFLLFEKTENHLRTGYRALIILGLTSICFFHSYQKSQLWASEFSVFEDAYHTEGGLQASLNYAGVLMEAKRYKEAVWITEDLYRTIPNLDQVQSVLAFAIVTSDEFTPEKKAEMLRKFNFTAPRPLAFLGDMEAQMEHYEVAENLLIAALKHKERRSLLRGGAEKLGVELYRRCRFGSKKNCVQKLKMVRGVDIVIPWSEAAFEDGLRSVNLLEAYQTESKN